jgi:arylsulfatase A-like enzyme
MTYRTLLAASLGLLLLQSVAFAQKPNIVYILCDDLGYGEIQAYNPMRGKVPTPNVNQLAREGMMFTDAHSASAVCTPTRYGLLTGRYPWRTRLQRGVVGPGGHKPLIGKDRLTIGDLLQKHGYATACIGKWHLGFRYNRKSDNAGRRDPGPPGSQIIGGPTTRGFDYFYGFPLSRTMNTVIENDEVVEKVDPVKMLPRLSLPGAEFPSYAACGQ